MDQPRSHWVHDLDPVIFQITDTLAVRWYGLAYVAGFITGFALLALYWRRGRSVAGPAVQENLAMAMVLGVLIGGRLGYFLLYEFSYFLNDPLVLLRVWEGGMASHGGFAGVAVAILWVCRRHRLDPLQVGDLVATTTPPGLLFGRIANFINGELWGKVSDVPWAVVFPKSAPGMPEGLIPARHPSQLYEAALEGLVLLVYMQWRFWSVRGRGPAARTAPCRSARPDHLMGEFLVAYSAVRFIGETFREPDAALILGMSRGSFYSLFLLLAGIGFIAWTRRGHLTKRQSP